MRISFFQLFLLLLFLLLLFFPTYLKFVLNKCTQYFKQLK